MAPETVLAEATFNRKVRSYWLLTGSILCVVTVIGIPFLPCGSCSGTTSPSGTFSA